MRFFRGIFRNRKKLDRPPLMPASRPIVDAFTEYISNEIPGRFIDTSKLQFVSRNDVLRMFQDEIANVTEEQIQERMTNSQREPLATYRPERETVLRQIIQETVKYVVLSHHWGETSGDSPSYQDIASGKRRVARSKKLVQFCKISRTLGCKLAWVGTCCIDKTNPVEATEAIYAMYKWYTNSNFCIVHLAESTSYADWVRESWFTQGWTLQELLPPRRVKFYNKNWQPFTPGIDDDKTHVNMVHPLETVTGISRAVLAADNSQGVHGCTFWEIMSWASRRQTARIEDRAYCLTGLLCVNLPISYGDGRRAFSCLVEAVVAKDPSWHALVWFGQPSVDHFALPLSPTSYPRFEAHMVEGRVGVHEFTIHPNELSLRSLPPIPMELCSVIDPDGPRKPFLVTLKPRSNEELALGSYGNLVVECGATRLKLIRNARQLSACIINHHAARSRKQGKLIVGMDYICFLLYSENGGDDETSWVKLTTDNLLQISCVGMSDTTIGSDMVTQAREPYYNDAQRVRMAGQETFTLPLVTTVIQSPTSE